MKKQKTDRLLTYFGEAQPDTEKLQFVGLKTQKTVRFLTYFGEAPPNTDELQSVGH
jgi:hypothetical protein